MKRKKSNYLVKTDAAELIKDDPSYYMDSYAIRQIFTKEERSKSYQIIWNMIAWINNKFPDGPIANMMFLSYLMGVYDDAWERDMVDSLNRANWK